MVNMVPTQKWKSALPRRLWVSGFGLQFLILSPKPLDLFEGFAHGLALPEIPTLVGYQPGEFVSYVDARHTGMPAFSALRIISAVPLPPLKAITTLVFPRL